MQKAKIILNEKKEHVLICNDGTEHVLTNAEKIHVFFNFLSVEQLNYKYSKEDQKGA